MEQAESILRAPRQFSRSPMYDAGVIARRRALAARVISSVSMHADSASKVIQWANHHSRHFKGLTEEPHR